MSSKNWWIFFLLIAITASDLFLASIDHPARIFTKASLMPILLAAYVMGQPNHTGFARLVLAALFFSWLGDIFLMFEKISPIYFMVGLLCFLTTHVLYILYFLKIKSNRISFLKKRPVMLLVIIAYTIELLFILWPNLGALQVPVLIYALVLSTMLATAAWQYGKIPLRPAILFVIGAFLFVLSDSALALNKFHQHVEGIEPFVMLTYVGAQVLIVLGSLAHLNHPVIEFGE